ncbi:SRPBCC family protein [Actinacidiphila glaucinigra]|uniref:SRPBCC family protein n=1 Tax=Actinacidiphila glaucinigra TaxID=235986 RepID=UPI002E2FC2E4|nr:SRPBCC family protein [Actinacidiphila glaucinigra]
MNIVDEINAIHRATGSRDVAGEEARTVLLRRTYDAPVEDVWDACTTAERIGRWFMPVTGELRLGGRYQLQGNAGGEVLRCEPPKLLRVSWVMGEAPGFSEVEVRLAARDAERTVLELEHVAVVPPGMWDRFGPGAVGVGWDLGLLGLGLYLAGEPSGPEMAEKWQYSDEARDFMTRSSGAWGTAYAASGAPEDTVAAAVDATTGFYVPARPE